MSKKFVIFNFPTSDRKFSLENLKIINAISLKALKNLFLVDISSALCLPYFRMKNEKTDNNQAQIPSANKTKKSTHTAQKKKEIPAAKLRSKYEISAENSSGKVLTNESLVLCNIPHSCTQRLSTTPNIAALLKNMKALGESLAQTKKKKK